MTLDELRRSCFGGRDPSDDDVSFVAMADGEPVAYVGVWDRTLPHVGRVAGITGLCVHPDYRGRGFSQAVMYAAKSWAYHQHDPLMGFMVLHCAKGLEEFYKRLGYWPVENLPRYSQVAMVNPIMGEKWPTVERVPMIDAEAW